jgi:protein O-GlcNAc transferase
MMNRDDVLATALTDHRAGRLDAATVLYRQLIEADAYDPDANHYFGILLNQTGNFPAALECLARAVDARPDDVKIRRNMGVVLQGAGRFAEAEAAFRTVLALDGDSADSHLALGAAIAAQGRFVDAVPHLQRAVALAPANAQAFCDLGLACRAADRADDSIAAFTRATTLAPGLAKAHGNLGSTLFERGRLDEAVTAWRRALEIEPNHPEIHADLGIALGNLGRGAEAIESFTRAIALDKSNPLFPFNLGRAYQDANRFGDAEDCYRQALDLAPTHESALLNLGVVLKKQQRLAEAAESYRKALDINPESAEAHCNLANVLCSQGQMVKAAAHYDAALNASPDFAEARLGRTMATLPAIVDTPDDSVGVAELFSQSLVDLARWSATHRLGAVVGLCQPFYLAYRPGNARAVLSRYGDLVGRAAAAHWQEGGRNVPNVPPSRDRFRLAIVSGHIRRHSVWDVILRGMVEHLDRQRFEVVIYHTEDARDDETVWAQQRADIFVQGPKPVAAWLSRIVEDRPDVIFYPEIGMDPVTGALSALRLAPLQVASWGHPLTTGLPCMDWFLSGEFLEGGDADDHYREKLVRLPGTGVCTTPIPIKAEPVAFVRRDANPDVIRFALCHTPFKLEPADDGLYPRIAKAVGRCEFWLVADDDGPSGMAARLKRRLQAAFVAQGLNPADYLRSFRKLTQGQFAGFLDEMDVYLDCPAFSGYTTAWQAVHRGLPVVTVEGEFQRQRLAAGLLRQIGQDDTVAATADEYVEIARRVAVECRDADARSQRRVALRDAAAQADNNVEVVRSLERHLIKAIMRP